MEQVAGELRQLASTVQGVMVDQVWHIVFRVAMLLSVQIQHELRQRAVHTGDLPFHHHETGAGQLHRSGKIQAAVHLTEGDVIADLEIKLARRAPAANFNVIVLVTANRYAVIRQVRNGQRDIADLSQQRFQLGFRRVQLFTQLVHFQA